MLLTIAAMLLAQQIPPPPPPGKGCGQYHKPTEAELRKYLVGRTYFTVVAKWSFRKNCFSMVALRAQKCIMPKRAAPIELEQASYA
ncbi:hypothetical protein [Sphingomonas baiyangensis]|uniref:Uncharacterized protein n=1 Tax=Sphingomonas baiyangensis TaxID=2572576 RepID=A0A4U1L3D8_9SPHN|nr:hypothetical protein [Sphingomonas baiyangensis]TKD50713.1 hypothetical protein FBR43_07975 [Sphingomonas baiyangensis]